MSKASEKRVETFDVLAIEINELEDRVWELKKAAAIIKTEIFHNEVKVRELYNEKNKI